MAQLLADSEVDKKVVELVASARERYGIPEGCAGADACRALGLRLRRAALARGTDGLLTAEGVVVVNAGIAWRPRVEFTIFHEVMHRLLDEDGELIELYTEALRGDDRAYKAAIERCCQAGAAEFLLPRRRVREGIAEHGCGAGLIGRLADRHGASIVASAIQLAACAPVDCYVAVCGYGVSPTFWPPDQTLYVEQAAMRPGMRYPWARHAPIPPDHLFHQAWETKRLAAGPSFVPFPSGKRMACEHGEAQPLGERVVGILYLGHPPRRGQLALNLLVP